MEPVFFRKVTEIGDKVFEPADLIENQVQFAEVGVVTQSLPYLIGKPANNHERILKLMGNAGHGPAHGRKALRAVHIDSYEAGPQNWTATFREDFQKRRGYDPLPFLPLLGIDKKKILLEEPIKALGVYTIPIKLHSDVQGKVKVWVVKE